MDYTAFCASVGSFLMAHTRPTLFVSRYKEGEEEVFEPILPDGVEEESPSPFRKEECSPEDGIHCVVEQPGTYRFASLDFKLDELFAIYQEESWNSVAKLLRTELENHSFLRRQRLSAEEYRRQLSLSEQILFDELRQIRADISREEGKPPYVIFGNKTLFEMCKSLPVTEEELRTLPGAGEKNAGEYASRFLPAIIRYLPEMGL